VKISLKSLQAKLLAPLVAAGVLVVVVTIMAMVQLQSSELVDAGLITARAVEQQVRSLRTFYTREVVDRANEMGTRVNYDYPERRDTLPLPDTLVHELGAQIGEEYPGTLVRLYSDHPFPHRAANASYDAFEKEALAALRRDPAQPFYRIERYKDRHGTERLSMRYAAADLMRASCVSCHNAHPESPKTDWRVGDLSGVVEVVVPVDTMAAGFEAGTLRLSLVIAVGFLITVAFTTFSGSRSIRPIAGLVRVFSDVGRGNLMSRATVTTSDEFAVLGRSTNEMIARLREVVGRLLAASTQVSAASEQILASSRQQEEGAVEQTGCYEEISGTARGNSDAARNIAREADALKATSERMLEAVENGRESLEATRAAMRLIVAQNEVIAERTQRLYEKSEAIIRIVDIIDEVSDRLDLLALNAGLEGSRVGEVGKGFMLVAEEMRRLAENVSRSTNEIKTTIQEIHRFTQGSISASNQGAEATKSGARETDKMSEAIEAIFALIEKSTEAARRITVATQQQLSSTQQVVDALGEMNRISNRGLSASRQVTEAAAELTNLASSLNETVATFKLAGDEVSDGQPPVS
jgi:methyl-accepting chemotaxis protein